MASKKRKLVSMVVTVSVPEGLSATRARQEVRAKLDGYGGYSSFYSHRGETRYLDDDGGVKVRRVSKHGEA